MNPARATSNREGEGDGTTEGVVGGVAELLAAEDDDNEEEEEAAALAAVAVLVAALVAALLCSAASAFCACLRPASRRAIASFFGLGPCCYSINLT